MIDVSNCRFLGRGRLRPASDLVSMERDFPGQSHQRCYWYTDPMGTCIIDLVFIGTGEDESGFFNHSFLLLTDNTGHAGNVPAREFRGGPANNGNPPPDLVLDVLNNALQVGPDLLTNARYRTQLMSNKCSCQSYNDTLNEFRLYVNQSAIPYGAFTNSNSVTSSAIQVLGLPEPDLPWNIWLLSPGWDTSLLPESRW